MPPNAHFGRCNHASFRLYKPYKSLICRNLQHIPAFCFGDLGGTQTRDTQNRNLMLYSTELRGRICEKLCKINDKAFNHQIICSTKESFNRKKNRNFATNYILNEE